MTWKAIDKGGNQTSKKHERKFDLWWEESQLFLKLLYHSLNRQKNLKYLKFARILNKKDVSLPISGNIYYEECLV